MAARQNRQAGDYAPETAYLMAEAEWPGLKEIRSAKPQHRTGKSLRQSRVSAILRL